mgnify:CR=1 FL=1
MEAEDLAQRWLTHLAVERGVSPHTLSNYTRDVHRYTNWLAAAGKTDLAQVAVGAAWGIGWRGLPQPEPRHA